MTPTPPPPTYDILVKVNDQVISPRLRSRFCPLTFDSLAPPLHPHLPLNHNRESEKLCRVTMSPCSTDHHLCPFRKSGTTITLEVQESET